MNRFIRLLPRTAPLATLAFAFSALFVAAPATAQEEEFGGDKKEEGEGGEGTDAPETYTVKDGDTLWNLSAKFLNNPWYWPKIWSYNPQLDNPNWIYPGNVIRFYPGGAAGDEAGEGGGDGDGDKGSEGGGDGDGEGGGDGDGDDGDEGGEDDYDIDLGDEATELKATFDDNDVKKSLQRLARRKGVVARRQFFIPEKKLQEAGEVENSPTEKSMLSLYDSVWVDFKTKPEPGAKLQIFRPTKTVYHPVKGLPLGTIIELVGELRVDANSDGKSLATITASWERVLRGDYVAQVEEAKLRTVEPVPNDSEVKGYVADTAYYEGTSLGQHTIVIVDKGEKDGVKPGNTFTIKRATDPLTGDQRGLTDEVIGRVLVTDVRDDTSVGLLTYSNRAIVAGDRIEMIVEKN
jgi:hypothetical protein